jgi:hypothetical protein
MNFKPICSALLLSFITSTFAARHTSYLKVVVIDTSISGQVTISNLNPGAYGVSVMKQDSLPYVDRDYKLVSYPVFLEGVTMIQTRMDDKQNTSSNLISFQVNRTDFTVYVFRDSLLPTLPSWMNGWTRLDGEQVMVSTPSGDPYYIYYKTFTGHAIPEPVVLGGNAAPTNGYNSHFMAVVPGMGPQSIADQGRQQMIGSHPSLTCFPIPAEASVLIKIQPRITFTGCAIHIYDINGTRIKSFTSLENNLIWDQKDGNNNKVPAGVYWVHLVNSAGNTIHTIAPQKIVVSN